MQTLSFGYKLPETGDLGVIWFPALEDNIERLNSHNHDGANSKRINPEAVQKLSSTIDGDDANWTSDNGNHSITVTVPAGISGGTHYQDHKFYVMKVLDSSNDVIHPTITRVSATQFTLTVNNKEDLTIYYV